MPMFWSVLQHFDGRFREQERSLFIPTLFDVVRAGTWQPNKTHHSNDGAKHRMEFSGKIDVPDGCEMTYRTDYYNPKTVPEHHTLRLQMFDPLFNAKVEHRFHMRRGEVSVAGGVHDIPWFEPVYGHRRPYQFLDAHMRNYNWLVPLVFDAKKKGIDPELFPEGTHQITCALWLLAAAADRENGRFDMPPDRAEASRRLAVIVRATNWGE